MEQEMAANERPVRARKWALQLGTLQRHVFIPVSLRLFRLQGDEYRLASQRHAGRTFVICPDWSNDHLQSFINNEADEAAMDEAVIEIG